MIIFNEKIIIIPTKYTDIYKCTAISLNSVWCMTKYIIDKI